MRLAFIARANRLAWMLLVSDVGLFGHISYLIRNLLLLFPGEVDKVIVLCADQKRDCSLVETSSLPVPFLDGVQCAFACQVKHEEYCNSIVADQWQHVDEFTLTTQIPNGESNLGVADGNCLFHKVYTWRRQNLQFVKHACVTHRAFGCSLRPSCPRRT
jgi:hypothetical protein